MELMKLALLCVLALLPLTLLKKYASEQAVLLTIAVVAAVLLGSISRAVPLLERLEELFLRAGIESTYLSVLLRTVAASLVTRICADLCRDAGAQTLATLAEIVGTLAALLISLPILEAVTDLLLSYLG